MPISFPSELHTPTLLLDKDRCLRNLKAMMARAEASDAYLRPHFKTHQSVGVASWFREAGIRKAAVSSLRMAAGFAHAGWMDLTLAIPFNLAELADLNALLEEFPELCMNLVIESEFSLRQVQQGLARRCEIWIKTDVGYGRTGIHWSNADAIEDLIGSIGEGPNTSFGGLLAHFGNTYGARGEAEIREIRELSMSRLNQLKARLHCRISVGDTPSCSLPEPWEGVYELRPGNFIFYDLSQVVIGSCAYDEIGVVMACPVIAVHPERNRVVVYGGGVHFSKDRVELESGATIFGMACEGVGADRKVRTDIRMVSLSQEHGILEGPDGWTSGVKPGNFIVVLPVHSCMTADLMGEYRTLEGETIRMLTFRNQGKKKSR